MTHFYRLKRENASRAATVPCHLAPPLGEAWMMRCGGALDATDLPLIDEGLLFLRRSATDGMLVALDESSRREAWVSDLVGSPQLAHGGLLVTFAELGKLHLVSQRTGRVEGVVTGPGAQDAVAQGRLLIARALEGGSEVVYAANLETRQTLWQYPMLEERRVLGLFAAGEDCVVLGTDHLDVARGDGCVVGLSCESGRELWRHSVADLTWQDVQAVRPGHPQGALVICGDTVIVEVVKHYIVALSLQDGRRLWTWHLPETAIWQGYLYGDRYYVIGGFGSYHVLDPSTGRLIFETDLRKTLPKSLRDVNPHAPLLISETHAFTGSLGPHVLAFDRETGQYAWSHAPEGAGSTAFSGAYFMSVNGRFYYADMSFRMYCLEEETPTDPVLTEQRRRS